jgi:steroid 5-alpha reductase family enzyme
VWAYIICAVIWVAIIVGWIIPVVRARQFYEVYMACGLGIFFSIIVLGLMVWKDDQIAPVAYLGLVLYVPGVALVAYSFITLKRKGKPESGWEPTTTLIDSGVYRVVRHPLYLGSALFTVGIMLIVQSIPSTVLGLVAVFCFWMVSRGEDKFNVEKFGDAYRQYMKEVPAWNAFKVMFVGRRNHG